MSANNNGVFRTSSENAATFKEPIKTFCAPWSREMKIRWYESSIGTVFPSQQFGPFPERFLYVTRSLPHTMEWKELAMYPDYRMFSTDFNDIELWTKQWFDELQQIVDLFKNGPRQQ